MRNIIVTGAYGFLGKRLVQELSKSVDKIYAVVREKKEMLNCSFDKNVEIIECDLTKDVSVLKRKIVEKIDVFYHLAWEGSYGEKRAQWQIQLKNVYMSSACFELANELKCKKFIGIGTISEFLIMNDSELGKQLKSQNQIYAISKDYTNTMLRMASKRIDMKFIWCRLSNIYSENLDIGNIISYEIKELLNGNTPTFSKGEQPYNFIYVDDCIEALKCIGEKKCCHDEYFLGGNDCKKLKDFLQIVNDIINPDIKIGLGQRNEDGLVYKEEWFTITFLQEDFDFKPYFSFEAGIKKCRDELQK